MWHGIHKIKIPQLDKNEQIAKFLAANISGYTVTEVTTLGRKVVVIGQARDFNMLHYKHELMSSLSSCSNCDSTETYLFNTVCKHTANFSKPFEVEFKVWWQNIHEDRGNLSRILNS